MDARDGVGAPWRVYGEKLCLPATPHSRGGPRQVPVTALYPPHSL